MAQKRFLSWLGLNETPQTDESPAINHDSQNIRAATARTSPSRSSTNTDTANPVARIRELEAELADLRARRDLTSLTKEEFEILATETAVSLVRTAQAREARSVSASQKVIQESSRSAQSTIQSAEETARQLLASADQRGKKILVSAEDAATRLAQESEAISAQKISTAQRDAEGIVNSKKREASNIISIARKNAEELVGEANQEVLHYKNWLTSTVTESERLYRSQLNSLAGATAAIEEAKGRLGQSFNALKSLHADIFERLEKKDVATTSSTAKSSTPSASSTVKNAASNKRTTKKSAPAKSAASKSAASKSAASKSAASKSASSKSSASKKSAPVKRSSAKKAATKNSTPAKKSVKKR